MSIIDQICDIEETLVNSRKDGEQKILQMHQDFAGKKAKMREHFVQELAQKNVELEQEMFERVEEYKANLAKSGKNIKELLTTEFESKKKDILQTVCENFWKE